MLLLYYLYLESRLVHIAPHLWYLLQLTRHDVLLNKKLPYHVFKKLMIVSKQPFPTFLFKTLVTNYLGHYIFFFKLRFLSLSLSQFSHSLMFVLNYCWCELPTFARVSKVYCNRRKIFPSWVGVKRFFKLRTKGLSFRCVSWIIIPQ